MDNAPFIGRSTIRCAGCIQSCLACPEVRIARKDKEGIRLPGLLRPHDGRINALGILVGIVRVLRRFTALERVMCPGPVWIWRWLATDGG